MSILIRGMEMPTSCRACHLKMNCDDCEGWECVCVPLRQQIGYLCDLPTDKRRDDCPLVPVPKHGRLIDADAMEKLMSDNVQGDIRRYPYSDTQWEMAFKWIDHQPTIIPTEEGE